MQNIENKPKWFIEHELRMEKRFNRIEKLLDMQHILNTAIYIKLLEK